MLCVDEKKLLGEAAPAAPAVGVVAVVDAAEDDEVAWSDEGRALYSANLAIASARAS